jgi:cytidyltransferase-like protein
MDFMSLYKKFNPVFIQEEDANDPLQAQAEELKDVVIFPGRTQPPHVGHVKLVEKMKKENPDAEPIIILVKGEKSSQDTIKNPFSAELQKKYLQQAIPGVHVEIFNNAYLPGIIETLKEKGMNVTKVYSGPDRAASYKSILEKAGLDNVEAVSVEDRFTPISDLSDRYFQRDLSASLVREILENNDLEDFLKVTVGYNEKDFNEMRDTLLSGKTNKLKSDINAKLMKLLTKIDKTKTDATRTKLLSEKEQLESELSNLK